MALTFNPTITTTIPWSDFNTITIQDFNHLPNTQATRDLIAAHTHANLRVEPPFVTTGYQTTRQSPDISFCNDRGETIGRLFALGNQLAFEGDATESARVFLLSVMRAY